MTGQQYFADGTGIAYFNDGTTQEFEHRLTEDEGYYFDEPTPFYLDAVPEVGNNTGSIVCGDINALEQAKQAALTNSSRTMPQSGDSIIGSGNITDITIIRGASIVENKSRAVEPSPIVTIKVNDTVTWVNEDTTMHSIISPPITGGSNIPDGTIIPSTGLTENGGTLSCTFTEPGGYHYTLQPLFTFGNDIKGAVIVEGNTTISTEQVQQPPSTSSFPFSQQLQSQQQESEQPQQQQRQQRQTQPENQGNSVSIVPGSSSLTTDAYSPNPIQVSTGTTVTWTNDDTQPHTVTLGENAIPDQRFDSGIMASAATFDHTFTEPGEYPYFCLLHPNMVGAVVVAATAAPASTDEENPATEISTSILEEGVMKTTTEGTLDIRLEAVLSEESRQANFQVSFLNPNTNTLHEHQDYDFRILKDGHQIFSAASQTGQAVLHNVDGTLIVPYTFQESGDYTIQVYLAGVGLPAIPTDEEATFPVTIAEEEGEGEEGSAPSEEETTRIAILAGAAVQGSPDYDPDPAEVPAGNSIVWNNEDTVPHTATSGIGPQDPASAQLFDTGIVNGGEESTAVQIQGASEGQTIPYYCIVHPYMTAELTITVAGQGGGGGGAAGGGATTLTILERSSIQGSPDYDPDELTVAAGSEVTVVNQDTLPHTVTSGTGPTDPSSAQLFDTSLINGGASATLSLAQVTAGQYSYYCMVHPYMTGMLTVVAAKTANHTEETTSAGRLDDVFEGSMPTVQPTPPSLPSPQPPQQINTSKSISSSSQQQLLQEQRRQAGATAAIVSISFGSSTLTADAYQPNPIQISVGETVRWVNDDSLPHTITSGENTTPDGVFNSGIMTSAATFEHTFEEARDYRYFCLLHPNMVGTVSVG
jgi:plastocyanin